MTAAADSSPVFLLSPRYRRETAAAIETTGRSVIAIRQLADAAKRFASSSAMVAVVDARGALEQGLALARDLAPQVEARRGALLMLVSRSDADALGAVYHAGATHFLVSPFGAQELGQQLRFAERAVRRLQTSGATAAVATAQANLLQSARWDWSLGSGEIDLTAGLSRLVGDAPVAARIDIETALERLDGEQRRDLLRGLRRLLRSRTGGEIEHSMLIDGRPHTLVHHVRMQHDERGAVVGMTATVEDLDVVLFDRRVAAHFDTLTGLANASYTRSWVDQLLGGTSRYDPACVVVLLAISRFDQINAGYGRAVADSLLQAVSRRLRRIAGEAESDEMLLGRLGGAEFLIAFAGPVTLTDAVFFSQKLGDAFERPFIVGGRVIHLACRIGIAAGEATLDGADTLFRRASAALAEAKGQEPNSFQVFMTSESGDTHARLASLESDLRRAAESGELEILFQPQVEIVSNSIVGVEALVRWRHPMFGVLPPETMLAVAEKSEYSVRLSEQILRQALSEASQWSETLWSLRVAVNITAVDMRSPDFARRLSEIFLASGFPAGRTTLEVTEGSLIENLERAVTMLSSLRERGVRIAIDDFGTGYSSLAYLKTLPLDYLKVDKRLVTDLTGSHRDRIVVRGVVDMARSLGMCVIAEGVESSEQLDSLVREGVNWYQGYHCAPPLTSAELERFVVEWRARSKAA